MPTTGLAGYHQTPWLPPDFLATTRLPGYHQTPWLPPDSLATTRLPGYHQTRWLPRLVHCISTVLFTPAIDELLGVRRRPQFERINAALGGQKYRVCPPSAAPMRTNRGRRLTPRNPSIRLKLRISLNTPYTLSASTYVRTRHISFRVGDPRGCRQHAK